MGTAVPFVVIKLESGGNIYYLLRMNCPNTPSVGRLKGGRINPPPSYAFNGIPTHGKMAILPWVGRLAIYSDRGTNRARRSRIFVNNPVRIRSKRFSGK